MEKSNLTEREQQLLCRGYPQHLSQTVELCGGLQWEQMPSSCILVAQLPD